MRALGRSRPLGPVGLPVIVGLAVALLAGVTLSLSHHQARPAVAPRVAIAAALRDPAVARARAGSHWNRITVTAIDDKLVHVSFLARGQLVAEAAVDRTGRVLSQVNDRQMAVPYGDWIAYQPALLVGLCALFVLMAGVSPWRRLRNLDVAAVLSFVVAVVLFQHRYLSASMLAAAPGMAYLILRCGLSAFRPSPAAVPSTALIQTLTPRLSADRRVRWLRALLVVLTLVYVMVGVGSPVAVDVVYAVMEGATTLIHGVLPYGHLPPGVIHGDTYPILSYALYAPLALLAPVTSQWDSVDGGLAVAVLAALVAGWAMFRTVAGPRGGARARRPAEVEEAGLRTALAWLAFPSLLITVSTGTTDVVLGAMIALAVLLWRRPAAAAGMLAAAGWFKLAPFALLPLSLAGLRGRRLVGALAALGAVSLPVLALLFALGGLDGPGAMLQAVAYQFARGSEQSVWSAVGIDWAQPFAQACVLGLIAAAVVTLRRDPRLASDRSRMAGLMAAVLLGLQLAANYWAFLYLVWIVPLIGLSLLAEPVGEVEPAAVLAPELASVESAAPMVA